MGLQGKVVVITGAKGGLGSHVTPAFLEGGANVVGISRSITQEDFKHARFMALAAPMNDSVSARSAIDTVASKFKQVDALVHLVGGFAGGADVADMNDDTLDRMLEANLRSAFYAIRAVLPHMRAQGRGSIVALASRMAVEPVAGLAAYSASKAALVSLVRTVALENKETGISANVVLAGTMDTEPYNVREPRR